jgi:hypothetical protein
VTPCRQPDAQADRKLQLDFFLSLGRVSLRNTLAAADPSSRMEIDLSRLGDRREGRLFITRFVQYAPCYTKIKRPATVVSWVRNGCFVMSPGPQTASNPFESSSAFRTMRGDRSAQQRKNARFADRTVPGGLGASRLAGGER